MMDMTRSGYKWIAIWLVATGLGWVVSLGAFSQTATSAQGEESDQKESLSNDNRCYTEKTLKGDIRERLDALKKKEEDFQKREEALVVQEKSVKEQIARLEELRKEIEKLEGNQSSKSEEKVSKLIETFEKMSPKGAAKILDTVNDELALTALSRISTDRLAKILNLMESKRSAKLSEMLTQETRVTRRSLAGVHGDAPDQNQKDQQK